MFVLMKFQIFRWSIIDEHSEVKCTVKFETYSLQILMFPSEIYARILYFCDAQTTLNALCVPDIYDSVGPVLLVQAHARRNAKTWCNSLRRIPAQYHDLYIRTCLRMGSRRSSGQRLCRAVGERERSSGNGEISGFHGSKRSSRQ